MKNLKTCLQNGIASLTIPKTACIVPWIHLHTWPNDAVYPCCLTPMEHPVGDLSKESLLDIWNNDAMKKLRLQMINGETPYSCRRCYEQESVGHHSLRMSLNKDFKHHKNLIAKTNADGSVNDMNIVYWDFRFSNICNMRCRSCGPQLSTGWYDEVKKIWGSLPDDVPQSRKNLNMWEEIQPFFDKVEEIYFAGGEPLIMEEHYKILNQLVDRKMFNTTIKYNTNFSQLRYKSLDVLEYWPLFKRVNVGASIDGYGKKAEYIRKGTDWSVIEHNRQQLKERAPKVEFYVNFTTSVFNSYHLLEFYEWAVDTKFIQPHEINFNIVQQPEYFRLQILPPDIKKDLTEKYKAAASKAKDSNVKDGFNMLANYMNKEDRTDLIPEFKTTTDVLDKLRNESFADTFPELEALVK